eukprot:g2791.t1
MICTIGIDFRIKHMVHETTAETMKLQIWDTAGPERFRTITSSYFRGTHAIMLFYSVSDRSSFTNVHDWLGEIHRYADSEVAILLVGNKCDIVDGRQVSYEEGQQLADTAMGGAAFMEISAKEDINVREAFEYLAISVRDQRIAAAAQQQEAEGRPWSVPAEVYKQFDVLCLHYRRDHGDDGSFGRTCKVGDSRVTTHPGGHAEVCYGGNALLFTGSRPDVLEKAITNLTLDTPLDLCAANRTMSWSNKPKRSCIATARGVIFESNNNGNTVVETHCEGSGGCVLFKGVGNFENKFTTSQMGMMQRALIVSKDPSGYNEFDHIVVNRYPVNRTSQEPFVTE